MTADVGQGGGGGVLRLGDGPHHDIPVRDNAADPIILDDNHVAHIPVPHGPGGLVHRGGAGQRHGVGGHHVTNVLRHVILLLWESCPRIPPALMPPPSDGDERGSGWWYATTGNLWGTHNERALTQNERLPRGPRVIASPREGTARQHRQAPLSDRCILCPRHTLDNKRGARLWCPLGRGALSRH